MIEAIKILRMGRSRATMPAKAAPILATPFAMLALFATAACGEGPPRQYEIGSATYSIPAAETLSVRTDPKFFIRISPPERSYDLIFDARLVDQVDSRGNPVIFSISDSPDQQLRYFRSEEGMIVCRNRAHPYGGCGASLEAAGATWSVLIPPARLAHAEEIIEQAGSDLKSYRMR